MRLAKFINEDNLTKDEKLLERFHKDTTQWFAEMGGQKVWRGTKQRVKALEKRQARKNRRPKDTPQEVHEYFDALFKKKFGWSARSEGVFAATSPYPPEQFGTVYIMYPCNGYKYIWSDTTNDLTRELMDSDVLDGSYDVDVNWKDEAARKEIADMIMDGYTNKDLPKASNYSTEVMFKCPKGYYLVEGEFFSKYYSEFSGD